MPPTWRRRSRRRPSTLPPVFAASFPVCLQAYVVLPSILPVLVIPSSIIFESLCACILVTGKGTVTMTATVPPPTAAAAAAAPAVGEGPISPFAAAGIAPAAVPPRQPPATEARGKDKGHRRHRSMTGFLPSIFSKRSASALLLDPDAEVGDVPCQSYVNCSGRYLTEAAHVLQYDV